METCVRIGILKAQVVGEYHTSEVNMLVHSLRARDWLYYIIVQICDW